MTNKERLDAIKDRAMFNQLAKRTGEITHSLVTLDEEDYDWLIEQAERAQELEELIEDYKTVNKELHDRRKKLRKQNKRYREALERQFGEFWEACVKVVGEDMAYDIVAEMPEEGEE